MKFIAFALSILTVFTCFGQSNEPDSVNVSFRVGHRYFDPALGNNREAMDSFIKLVQKAKAEDNIESIVVRAYTSPDGSNKANTLLAQRRCDVIADLIASRTHVNPSLIRRMPEGIAWDELRRLIADNPDVPSRQKVLDILDNTPVLVFDANGKIIDGRKKQLMDLKGGTVYRWLYANLFPRVRNAVAVALIRKHNDSVPIDSESKNEETIIEAGKDTSEPENVADQSDIIIYEEETTVVDTLSQPEKVIVGNRVALKTNLLGYAVLMPNLELEWMCAKRWSVALEVQSAWYSKTTPEKHKVYRLATLTPEVRYWPIERKRWHGMYVGLFGGIGMYDLSKGKKGHEGEGFMTGISAGYMWPISKHLSLDAGIGIGYMRARDKVYVPLDGHYLYQLTKNINYVGPLRLKLSLVWRLYSEKIKR